MTSRYPHPSGLRAVAAAAAGMLLLACGGSQQTSTSSGPVTIAVIGDFSGPVAAYSTAAYAGIQIAADEINSSGGINGAKIELKQYNDQNNPDEGVNIAKRVPDEALAAIVASGSSPMLAMGPFLNREQIPFIATVSSNPGVTESGWQYANRMHLSDRDQMNAIVDYAIKTKGMTKLGILYDTTDYGQGGNKLAQDALKAHNQTLQVAESWDPNAVDYSSQVLKVKQANLQGLLIWGVVAGSVRLEKQLHAAGVTNVQLFGSGGIVTQQFFQLGGSDVNGTIATQAYVDTSQPKVSKFAQKYQAATNRPVDVFAAQSYDALYVLANAIKKAGTKSSDRKQISSDIRSTKYDGLIGHLEFDKNGQNIRKIYLAQAENGAWNIINK